MRLPGSMWWGLMAFSGLLPGAAHAECTLGLDVRAAAPLYDFFADAETSTEVEVRVTHLAGDACDFFVTFDGGGAGSYARRMAFGSETLDYQLSSQASGVGVLKALPDAVESDDVLAGAVSTEDSSPRVLTAFLSVPAHQVVPAGSYADTVTVAVYEGTLGGAHALESSAPLAITTAIGPDIELSLRDTGSAFDPLDTAQGLDFGVLENQESLGFDLLVRTNAGYAVTVLSENRGVLRRAGSAASSRTTVGYDLKVDGLVRDLSGAVPVEVASGVGVTVAQGDRHPVLVTIGSVEGKVAGIYEDNLTITAVTAE